MVDLVTLRQLEFRISGGETNTNVFQSLGGAMSNVLPDCKIVDNVWDNVWDDITVFERLQGEVSYRWIYFYNNSLETINNLKMYFHPTDYFVSATFHKNGPMAVPTLLDDEYHAPPTDEVGKPTDLIPAWEGITDNYDTTRETLLEIGPLEWIAIGLKRTIPANTDSQLRNEYKLVLESRT